jgi:serine/threonine protein kinase
MPVRFNGGVVRNHLDSIAKSGRTTMSEQGNQRIGDYEILGVLGAGGMGQVFKVRNVISDRIEAMKIILPDLAGRQDLAERFLREIKLLAGLNHPNIAGLRTALTLNNQLVMIMEYVEGTTVSAQLEKGPLPVPDAVNYIRQVLEALSFAHQHNIIHRDIKPSNMMVTPEGVVKLMDFGIARSGESSDLTETGMALGSLYYMSPEQVKGQPTDSRSDLYSVGASLYEMVTGERPFKADSSYSLMAAHVQQPPKPPIELRANLPGALNQIILLAMAKEPGQRFQTADAFRNALKAVPGAVPVAGAPAMSTPAATAGGAKTASFVNAPPVPAGDGAASFVPPPPARTVPPPQPVPGVMELSRQQSSNKGKYMALGGLLVVAFLVAAGIYFPRMNKTRAGEKSSRTQQSTGNATGAPSDTGSSQSAPNALPSANAAPSAATPAKPDAGTPAQSAPAGAGEPGNASAAGQGSDGNAQGKVRPLRGAKHAGEKTEIPSAGDSATTGTAAMTPADNSAELADVEQQVDQLSARAAAVNDSLDNLRRQQSAQGLGLRGDIASTQERMKIHVGKAQAALESGEVEKAKKYAAQAEAEMEQLEKFLGR